MFLVVPDRLHGLVAAPESSLDLTPETTKALAGQGFTWNGEIEAYSRPANHGPEDVETTAGALRELGHYVLSSWTPLPAH